MSKITPAQKQAINHLIAALNEMLGQHLGIQAIACVLNDNFKGLLSELHEFPTSSTWVYEDDPFRKSRPEDSIVP
jgi:hypothetical protein